MSATGTGREWVYTTAVAVHVVASLVSFVAISVSGLYAGTARRAALAGAPPGEEVERYFRGRNWASWFLWAIPAAGAIGVALHPEEDFGQVWVVGGLILWGAAGATALVVMWPAERAIRLALAVDGAPLPRAAFSRLATAAAICDVLFVAALVLMLLRPGGP